MPYEIEGQLLEVCPCNVLCPCWIGEDPDGDGTCDSVNSYHIERGQVNGIDVAGRTLAVITHIPGNVLKGNWRVALIVDDGASSEQLDAIVSAFTGKLGGPLADLAGLVGEVIAVETAPIAFEVHEGKGSLRVGSLVEADMEPYRGPTGQVTTLNESVFTTIPGAPAWVSKASTYRRNVSRFGLNDVDLSGHNAIQGAFRFAG
ncbi:MAG TPA: DUF1326 domain-containing protein [Dehalococcoidia bacterium]|nr:DUF1326 domain-containing protein [Dehalococcoidia bacterium]